MSMGQASYLQMTAWRFALFFCFLFIWLLQLHNLGDEIPHSSICQIPSSCQVITGRRGLFNIHNHVSLTFSKGSQSQSLMASCTARA